MWQFQGLRVGADGVLTPRAQGAGVAIPYVLPPEPSEGGIKTYVSPSLLAAETPFPVAQSRLQTNPPLGSRLKACAG